MALTYRRPAVSPIHFPSSNEPPLRRLVSSLLQKPNALPTVLKTKRYIEERLNGTKVMEAKKRAGFHPMAATNASIMANPMAQALLDELVKQKIPDPAVADRLKEMWDAQSSRDVYDPTTKTMIEVVTPNWDLRKYAMDKRLALGGYSNGSLPESREQNIVTQIQFTTINVDS